MQINPANLYQSPPAHSIQRTNQETGDQAAQKSSTQAPLDNVATKPEKNIEAVRELQQLKTRDQEVRSHEQAHLAAAGNHATGGASFSYNRGPDGRLYAVSGEVGIDTSAVPGDPTATLEKAETIQRAALAPANPSSQDIKVAAEASHMAMEARMELQQQGQAARQADSYETVEKSNEAEPIQILSTHA